MSLDCNQRALAAQPSPLTSSLGALPGCSTVGMQQRECGAVHTSLLSPMSAPETEPCLGVDETICSVSGSSRQAKGRAGCHGQPESSQSRATLARGTASREGKGGWMEPKCQDRAGTRHQISPSSSRELKPFDPTSSRPLKDSADVPQEALVRDCASKGWKSKVLDLPHIRVLELSSLPSHMDCAGVLQPCPNLGVKAAVMCRIEACGPQTILAPNLPSQHRRERCPRQQHHHHPTLQDISSLPGTFYLMPEARKMLHPGQKFLFSMTKVSPGLSDQILRLYKWLCTNPTAVAGNVN